MNAPQSDPHVEHTISTVLAAIVRALGLPADINALDDLDDGQATGAAANALRALAGAIDSNEVRAGRHLDALIERLERELDPLVSDHVQRDERQRQASYEQLARSAIADALRSAGITPLAGQE